MAKHPGIGTTGGSTRYGPTALVTPANAVTFARLLASPVLVGLVIAYGVRWPIFVLAVAVFATDGLDGWIARRHGATSSGAFLDPLADKFVVLGVLYTLVGRGTVSWIPVSLIALREIAMSAYRSLVARKGVSVPARPLAKTKTATQDLAVGLFMLPAIVNQHTLLSVILWVATALTIASGVQYLYDGIVLSRHARR